MINIEQLLADEAEHLLQHKCTGIPKESLHLPGPDYIDRVVAMKDRKTGVLRSLFVRAGERCIQFHQELALPHLIPFTHKEAAHHTGFHWLDGLDPPGRNDLAGGCTDDIHLADHRPENGQAKEQHDRPEDVPADGQRRGFLDLQGRGEKFEFVLCHLSVVIGFVFRLSSDRH